MWYMLLIGTVQFVPFSTLSDAKKASELVSGRILENAQIFECSQEYSPVLVSQFYWEDNTWTDF